MTSENIIPILKNIEIEKYRRFEKFKGVKFDFCKFNLMYGWNYSGKTTLSNIFSNFNGRPLTTPVIKEGLYNLIKRDDNQKLTQNDSNKLKIHVFNPDYIKKNLFFDSTSTSNVILVTEGATEIETKIIELKTQKEALLTQIKVYPTKEKEAETTQGNFRKKVARNIAEKCNLVGFDAKGLPAIEKEVDITELSSYIINEETDLIAYSKTIKNPTKLDIQSELFLKIYYDTSEFTELINKTVLPSDALNILQNKGADEWVKNGLMLHQNESKCLFCGGDINSQKIEELNTIFESEFDKLAEDLKKILDKFILIEDATPNTGNIVESLQKQYIDAELNYQIEKTKFNNKIKAIKKIIDSKMKNRNIKMCSKIHFNQEKLLAVTECLNEIIKNHNKYVGDEVKQKALITDKIKKHYIAEMLQSEEYKASIKKICVVKAEHSKLRTDLQTVLQEIEKLETQISDVHKGAEVINKNLLKLFIGQSTVKLSVENDPSDTTGTGKKITRLYRDSELAVNLSEGEKTSIAFAHFLATLEDSINSKTSLNEIIFIDDPISSLDHNHIYSVSIILKELRDNFNQMFVATHNFELFRLLSYGASTKEKKEGEDAIPPRDRLYYVKRNDKISEIVELPKALVEFKTEYNFLFHNLNEFKKNPESIDFFMIGNCARRFLEIYLQSKYPNTKKLDQKLDDYAKHKGIDKTELTILYKIVNDESHFLSGLDKSYLKNAVDLIFQTLENKDKNHYDCLIKPCN